jgi:hypothetical protein
MKHHALAHQECARVLDRDTLMAELTGGTDLHGPSPLDVQHELFGGGTVASTQAADPWMQSCQSRVEAQSLIRSSSSS